jgi:hypothetical protein
MEKIELGTVGQLLNKQDNLDGKWKPFNPWVGKWKIEMKANE